MDKLSATLLLLTTMDPLGNVANFLGALRRVAPKRRTPIIARELVIALLILLFFLFGGRWLLGLLHLKNEALYLSGGVVLFLIALKMVFPDSRRSDEEPLEEPFIVPLATPLVAGPSVIATLLVLSSSEPERRIDWLIALISAWGITSLILLFAPSIARILRERGTLAVERLMGMILVMVSIQMFLNGLDLYLASRNL